MKRRVFITGVAGFIGFHAARKLHLMDNMVFGYDNFNDYYDVSLKRARAELLKNEGMEIAVADICNSGELRRHLEVFQPTHILHLAAQAGVRYSLDNPQAYLKSNVDGFLNILEVCRENPHVKLVYASSSSVYGLNEKIPFSIHDRTDHQASLYGVTKKANELMAQTYGHLFGVKSVGLRFFTVYGPWGRPDMAYFSFARDILAGKAIKVFNSGMMKRDFTYIDDIIEGTIAALDYIGPPAVFNLGGHQPEELGTLISLLEKHLDRKAVTEYLPMQQGDVVETYADIEESRRMLGFHPKVSLDEGIKEFTAWYLSSQL